VKALVTEEARNSTDQTAKIHYFSRYCPPSVESTDKLASFDAHRAIMYLHHRFPTIVEIPHLNIETPLLHLSAMEKCESDDSAVYGTVYCTSNPVHCRGGS
jgi:hypothetical protein